MSGLINYISCGILWLGLLAKAPDVARNRRDPFLLSISSVLAFASLCFLLGAAPTVGFINQVSGVPNLAAPLTYATITAYSAAHVILIVHWRGGPTTARTARRWVLVYAAVLAGIAVTYALGDASEERRTDFDTYYATTPFIAEMIVLYLVAHLTAVTVSASRSLGWARRVHGPLRAGLLTMGLGTLVTAGYGVSKIVAVIARWCGRDWSVLGTTIAPACAGLGAALTVVGILVPLVGHHLTHHARLWREYMRLRPLEQALEGLLKREHLRIPRPSRPSPAVWLAWRQNSIYNGLHYLDRYVDSALFQRTYADRLRLSDDLAEAEAAAWATAITAATRAAREGRAMPSSVDETRSSPARPEVPALLRIADELARRDGSAALPLEDGAVTAGSRSV
ncbi:MAB_1171c family putative transporter [Streptomyces sp. NPDC047085]|uniref:MAB_1171c family putative transporter n=1 Tax=Streptomyces sp. NPDC047085 TaxID=3155140 RepID=UPI0033F62587